MLKTAGTAEPKVVWRALGRSENPQDTEALHAVMSSPILKDGYILWGMQLRPTGGRTGRPMTHERVWETLKYTTNQLAAGATLSWCRKAIPSSFSTNAVNSLSPNLRRKGRSRKSVGRRSWSRSNTMAPARKGVASSGHIRRSPIAQSTHATMREDYLRVDGKMIPV